MSNTRGLEPSPAGTALKDLVDIQHQEQGRASKMLARRAYEPGELIFVIEEYTVQQKPSWQSLQISETRHIVNPTLRFMNHSCEPSAVLNTETLECRARRPIAAGDELTFFYPATEWAMEEPFECHCGADACLGDIRGAKYLPSDVRERYQVNAHILRLVDAGPSREVRE